MNYLDVAIEAAKAGGKVHKKYFEQDIEVNAKSCKFDLVTVADLESEKAIVDTVKMPTPSLCSLPSFTGLSGYIPLDLHVFPS